MKKWIVNSTEAEKCIESVIGWFPNEAKEQNIINYLHHEKIKVNVNDYRIAVEEDNTKTCLDCAYCAKRFNSRESASFVCNEIFLTKKFQFCNNDIMIF